MERAAPSGKTAVSHVSSRRQGSKHADEAAMEACLKAIHAKLDDLSQWRHLHEKLVAHNTLLWHTMKEARELRLHHPEINIPETQELPVIFAEGKGLLDEVKELLRAHTEEVAREQRCLNTVLGMLRRHSEYEKDLDMQTAVCDLLQQRARSVETQAVLANAIPLKLDRVGALGCSVHAAHLQQIVGRARAVLQMMGPGLTASSTAARGKPVTHRTSLALPAVPPRLQQHLMLKRDRPAPSDLPPGDPLRLRLTRDMHQCLFPSYTLPFRDVDDAVARLSTYYIMELLGRAQEQHKDSRVIEMEPDLASRYKEVEQIAEEWISRTAEEARGDACDAAALWGWEMDMLAQQGRQIDALSALLTETSEDIFLEKADALAHTLQPRHNADLEGSLPTL